MEEEERGVQRYRQKKERDGVLERRRRSGREKRRRGRAEGTRRREKESSLCISGGNYRCRFALPLATWLNSFPSSLCPSPVPLGRYIQICVYARVCMFVCVCTCVNVEGGKSGNLHNKLGEERGERKKSISIRKKKMVFPRSV